MEEFNDKWHRYHFAYARQKMEHDPNWLLFFSRYKDVLKAATGEDVGSAHFRWLSLDLQIALADAANQRVMQIAAIPDRANLKFEDGCTLEEVVTP